MSKAFALACLLLGSFPQSAAAQWQWHYTGMAGAAFLGRTTLVDLEHAASNVHKSFGGGGMLLGSGIVGVEGLAMLTPGFFQAGDQLVKTSRTLAVMGNGVVTTPRRWTEYSLRPYAAAGFGVLRASEMDTANIFPVHLNLKGFDIGGGAIGFLTTNTGLRFDWRYFSTLNRSDQTALTFGKTHLGYMTVSVGIVFRR